MQRYFEAQMTNTLPMVHFLTIEFYLVLWGKTAHTREVLYTGEGDGTTFAVLN
jgi:hypothetical protein